MLKKRSDKKAFFGLIDNGTTTYTRMKFFTELSTSKNAQEYSRQYVDEVSERTDVTGYSPSISFGFDDNTGNDVLADIANIIDNELTGTDAQREIISVDFTQPSGGGFVAYKRTYAVIADSEGGDMDAYTYSGNFNSVSDIVKGVATIATPVSGDSKSVETITFVAD